MPDAILDARGLGYTRGNRPILSGIDLTVSAGERVGVTGPSGSGKSSLLAMLAGLATPTAGEVRIDGQLVTGVLGHAEGVALVLQGYALVSLLSASENVEVALRAVGRGAEDARQEARRSLERVNLGPHADQLIEELSGGQQQRAAVARALALSPRLLIADEPTAELDQATRRLILDCLFEVADRGGALVLATHDPGVAERCDSIIDLHEITVPSP